MLFMYRQKVGHIYKHAETKVRHKKLLSGHVGPKSQSKVLFCLYFSPVNCITAFQSVLFFMTRWVLTVLCWVFDLQAPGEEARAPEFDSDGAAEPKGPSKSHCSQMWAEHFLLPPSAKHSPDLGTLTNTMHRAIHTVRKEQEHFTALPMWPRFILTAQDRAKDLRLCWVTAYAWFNYSVCVVCQCWLGIIISIKPHPAMHEMFYWCDTKGYCFAVKNVRAQKKVHFKG